MVNYIIQVVFPYNSARYEWAWKKGQRICDLLNTETKPPKISEITGVSLLPPSNTHPNPLDYAIWGVFEKKRYGDFQANIASLKTAIEKEWNKMSEEFIWRHENRFEGILIKYLEKMVAILSKFTVLSPSSYFVVYSF